MVEQVIAQNRDKMVEHDFSEQLNGIKYKFVHLQEQLDYFKLKIQETESKMANTLDSLLNNRDQFDIFQRVREDTQIILHDFNNLVALNQQTDSQHHLLLRQVTSEDLFRITMGSLVRIQNNILNQCLLYEMFDSTKLMQYLNLYKELFLGANGEFSQRLIKKFFRTNGTINKNGFQNIDSNIFEVIYEEIEAMIQQQKSNFQTLRHTKQEIHEDQEVLFNQHIQMLESKKWLQAEFTPTSQSMNTIKKFFMVDSKNFVHVKSLYTNFLKVFFSNDILKFYSSSMFEILKVSHPSLLLN
jgi:hypothetical protein